jgi:hypothetical protein
MTHIARLMPWLCCLFVALAGCQYLPNQEQEDTTSEVDLESTWQVTLVAADSLPDSIPPSPTFLSLIELPGTLDDVGLGQRQAFDTSLSVSNLKHFSRERQFIGRAWYQLAINIPDEWKGRRAELSLERVLWRSQLWVDGEKIGEQNSLSTPHRYVIDRLDTLKRGLHVLSLLVDNRDQVPGLHLRDDRFAEPSQTLTDAYTEHAQVKWNGVLGEIALRLSPDTGLQDLTVFPEPAQQRLRISATPRHLTPGQAWQAKVIDLAGDSVLYQTKLTPQKGQAIFELPKPLVAWNLKRPRLYRLCLWPEGMPQQIDSVTFGYREIALRDGQLHLNGQPVFLRGVEDHGLFPALGRPAMDRADWLDRLAKVQSYGFNLLRFPSWCPPEAAFVAADRLGMLLDVSLPLSRDSISRDSAALVYLLAESERIRQAYGHHPSLMCLSLGAMADYAGLSSTFQGEGRFLLSRDSLRLPQVGGYAMYPPVQSATRYDGVLRPINLLAIRQDLAQKNLLAQATAMSEASGAWALRLMQADIQAIMADPGAVGFVLPFFRDYAGRGGIWAGLVEADGKPKTISEADRFALLNADLVLLPQVRSSRLSDGQDSLRATLHLLNYQEPLDSLTLRWKLTNHERLPIQYGTFTLDSIPLGLNQAVATLTVGLDVSVEANDLHLDLALGNGPYRHAWEGWVLPPVQRERDKSPSPELITRSREQALQAWQAGKSVLWQVDGPEQVLGPVGRDPWRGSPLFMEATGPTLGLWIDTAHQALASFPSASHRTDLWAPLLTDAHSLALDSLENDSTHYASLVSVIDHFTRNRRLSLVAEAKGGPGRMLITSLDLSGDLRNRPVAQALRQSLLRYLAGEDSIYVNEP